MPGRMGSSALKFIRSLTVYTVIIGLLSYALRHWFAELSISPAYLFIVGLMYAITAAIIWMLDKSMDEKLSRFTNAFMLLNFGKLLLYTIIIFIYAYLNRGDAISFIISFFIYYLLYMGFEIFVLLKINQQKGNSSAGRSS